VFFRDAIDTASGKQRDQTAARVVLTIAAP
jgi:hypothetical protein